MTEMCLGNFRVYFKTAVYIYIHLHIWAPPPPGFSPYFLQVAFPFLFLIKIWYISYNDCQYPSSDHCCYYYLQQWPARAEKSIESISWGPNLVNLSTTVLWIHASSFSWKFTRYNHSLFLFHIKPPFLQKTNVPTLLQIMFFFFFFFLINMMQIYTTPLNTTIFLLANPMEVSSLCIMCKFGEFQQSYLHINHTQNKIIIFALMHNIRNQYFYFLYTLYTQTRYTYKPIRSFQTLSEGCTAHYGLIFANKF